MPSFFKIPLIWPFKMVPISSTPGIHFDDDWACKQILSFERKVNYYQKWQRSDITRLQIESSIVPENLKLLNRQGVVVYEFGWTPIFAGINYTIYELTFDLSPTGIADGIYFLSLRATLLSVDWRTISEPIFIKDNWPLTTFIKYKHRFNDYDVAWSTGIEMGFRVESAITDFEAKSDRTTQINQIRNVVVLNGIPYRKFKLTVGTAPGVANWVVDLLNRIFVCSSVNISGKYYKPDESAQWEITRVKGYPLIGAALDILESDNVQSLGFFNTEQLAPGLVAAYNIETGFFGPGSIIPIIEVQENS